jgi:hypothetical protein
MTSSGFQPYYKAARRGFAHLQKFWHECSHQTSHDFVYQTFIQLPISDDQSYRNYSMPIQAALNM